uniref:Uncharacterized protein n=1 Tax=Eutreptiella gymnastica TaxID=73025 RepID=A0A7S4CZ10_9EUGL
MDTDRLRSPTRILRPPHNTLSRLQIEESCAHHLPPPQDPKRTTFRDAAPAQNPTGFLCHHHALGTLVIPLFPSPAGSDPLIQQPGYRAPNAGGLHLQAHAHARTRAHKRAHAHPQPQPPALVRHTPTSSEHKKLHLNTIPRCHHPEASPSAHTHTHDTGLHPEHSGAEYRASQTVLTLRPQAIER